MASRKKLKKKLDALQRKTEADPRPDSPAPAASRQQFAVWKKWLFRLVAITAIPAILFVTVELSLRAFGFGYPTGAIIEVATEAGRVCRRNIKFGWRFFPKNVSRVSEPFSFAADKPEDAYRIFVLGGSAAQGTPDPAYAFSRILNVMLNERYPGVRFEVVNMAITAVNSHVVREIARDCARYQPDLFIVYLGNNEVVGPFGAGTVFGTLSPNLAAIRASVAMKSLKLGQLVERLTDSFRKRDDAPLSWQGLRMFLDKKVRPDSEDLQHVYSHFRHNLGDIIQSGLDGGGAVIVSTVASNLNDCPPFSAQHRLGLDAPALSRWSALYNAGIDLESRELFGEALQQYLQAAAIDDEHADLQFRMGRCYQETGAYEKAKARYLRARDLDTLRFRADSEINGVIHAVAGGFGGEDVRLVDAVAFINDSAPHGLPGAEFFYEHVHLRFKGAYLIAKSVLKEVEKLLPLEMAGEIPTEEECAARLAQTGWDRLRLLNHVNETYIKKPPSTDQLYFERRVAEWALEIESLGAYRQRAGIEESAAQYREAIRLWPSDWKLRAQFGDFLRVALRDNKSAAEQWRLVIERVPHYNAYSMLGMSLGMQGRFDEAIRNFNLALEINPQFDQGYANLASTLSMKGDKTGAAENFMKALQINPQFSPQVHMDLAKVLAGAGRNSEAIEHLRQALIIYPESAELHFYLGAFLAEEKQPAEAIEELRHALSLNPDHPGARAALNKLGER
jgi:tetratricopeptide (TPR) repeat protein